MLWKMFTAFGKIWNFVLGKFIYIWLTDMNTEVHTTTIESHIFQAPIHFHHSVQKIFNATSISNNALTQYLPLGTDWHFLYNLLQIWQCTYTASAQFSSLPAVIKQSFSNVFTQHRQTGFLHRIWSPKTEFWLETDLRFLWFTSARIGKWCASTLKWPAHHPHTVQLIAQNTPNTQYYTTLPVKGHHNVTHKPVTKKVVLLRWRISMSEYRKIHSWRPGSESSTHMFKWSKTILIH
jgi:hypothetical protein